MPRPGDDLLDDIEDGPQRVSTPSTTHAQTPTEVRGRRPLDRDHPATVAVRQVLAALVAFAVATRPILERAATTIGLLVRRGATNAGPVLQRTADVVARTLDRAVAARPRRQASPEPITDAPPNTTTLAAGASKAVAIAATLVALIVVAAPSTARTIAKGVDAGDAGEDVALPELAQRTELFAANGEPMGVLLQDDGNRVVVPLDQVPKVVQDAVVDTEDADFWEHDGIDLSGVARAARRNVEAGAIAQGGSTITQQLAKSTLGERGRRHDLHRKLSEAVLALRLDDQLTKQQILERYLNTIYFGQGAYGIATAAETYFAKPLDQLTVDQAALLAGIIRGPSLYDPVRHPDAARSRRQQVLERMVAEGDLTRADADAAAQQPLPTAYTRPTPAQGFVADAARAELLADPRLGETPEQRARAVLGGGLRVHTTVDPAVQQLAQEAVTDGIPSRTKLTAALVSVDPSTGAIRALVGGADYGQRQFDAAIDGAGRQTGSSFKVFTLVAALQQGHVTTEAIDGNEPCPIPNPGGKPNPWTPGNYEGEAFGTLSLTDATVHSSNCAFARLASTLGADAVAKTARDLGITAPLQKVPSMTLGTNTVPPVQMAAAYATLAAEGVARTPHVVERVERRDGSLVFANDGAPRRVIDEQVARLTTAVLGQVVARGTGRAAALPDGRPVAGKTGTAQNHQDAWFVGYTPQLATAVWMGDLEGEKPMLGIGGINVTGGSYPARLWQRFMAGYHAGRPVVGFTAPAPEPPPTAAVPPPAPETKTPSPPKEKGGKRHKGD